MMKVGPSGPNSAILHLQFLIGKYYLSYQIIILLLET